MAGLVPAIHVFCLQESKTWMPGTSPGMTRELRSLRPRLCSAPLRKSYALRCVRGTRKTGEGPGVLRRTPHFQKHQPACKPGSVGHRLLAQPMRDGHSSGTMFAHCLEQPTRTASLTSPCGVFAFGEQPALPSLFGFAPGVVCHAASVAERRGALLPHLFTLTPLRLAASRGGSFSVALSLGPFPACAKAKPRRMLSGTVCRWSPDFPPPQPFGPSGSGRPAD